MVAGSHGGILAGRLAVARKPRAVILHDAGIGLAGAGVAGLRVLASTNIPAACVSHRTARIGDPSDMLARGRLSVVNPPALELGLTSDMPTTVAVELLREAHWSVAEQLAPMREARHVLRAPGGSRTLVLIDSASLADSAADAGAVVVTGSHGGLVGGNVTYGLKAKAFAAVFNDAGGGIDNAGFRRLPVLEAQGVAAATVSAESARIGEATSTLAGLISRVNLPASRLGLKIGETIADFVYSWIGA